MAGDSLEKRLAAKLLQNPQALAEIGIPKLENGVLSDILRAAEIFYKQYRKPITNFALEALIDEEAKEAVLRVFEELKTIQVEEDLEFLLEQQRKEELRREILAIAERLLLSARANSVEEAREFLLTAVSKLTDGKNRLVKGEFIEDFEERLKLLHEKREHPERFKGIPTGIPLLDKYVGGSFGGDLGVVFGESSAGKSFFLLEIAYNAYLAGKRVLVLTLEMAKEQWERRLDARISGIPGRLFKFGQLNEEQERVWKAKISEVRRMYDRGARLFIVYSPRCTPQELQAEMEKLAHAGHEIDVVVVDYINMMGWKGSYFSQQQMLADIAEELKNIALIYNIPVWTAAQKKSTEYRKRDPDLNAVGYSTAIIQIADVVVALTYFPDVGRLEATLLKQRDGIAYIKEEYTPNYVISLIHQGMI